MKTDMRAATMAMAIAFIIVLLLGVTVPVGLARYLGLLSLVLVESAVRSLRVTLEGRYSDRWFFRQFASSALIVLVLAWVGSQLSLGMVGDVPSAVLALEIVLVARILVDAERLRSGFGLTDEMTAIIAGEEPVPTDGPTKAGKAD